MKKSNFAMWSSEVMWVIKFKADYDRNKESLDVRYNNLPELFRKRIDKYRKANDNFRWRYELFEMFCCEQAVVIANAISKLVVGETDNDSIWGAVAQEARFLLNDLCEMSRIKRREVIPDIDEDHSSMTFKYSANLAWFSLTSHPECVIEIGGPFNDFE